MRHRETIEGGALVITKDGLMVYGTLVMGRSCVLYSVGPDSGDDTRLGPVGQKE